MAQRGPGVGERLGRRPQLSDEVAAYVRDLIMAGQVREGDFLRLERLAADLGVSVTPVREALLALRGEGFVQLEPRRGFVVAPLSRQDVQDLFRVHADVAAELAARAARRMTPEVLAELERLQEEMEAAARAADSERVSELNHRFHRAINRSADSNKLAWVLGTVVRYAPRRFFGQITGWPEASSEDHIALLAAFRAGDPEAASTAMHRHITHAGELLADHLAERGLWREA
ncbi:MAG: FCD domain-containing protein [Streptosporangiales bacterium]|nr:FCD domain-containing protein [Streptosporangiales bacterium]